MRNNQFSLVNINVNYRISATEHEFLKKLRLSTASIGFYATDLFQVSSIERERGINYPFARQFSMSLNLTF